MTVWPRTSTRFASAGTLTLLRGPMATMRLPSTTRVPSAMTSSPRIVTMRPPTSAMRPVGLSLGCMKPIFTPPPSAGFHAGCLSATGA